MKDYYVIHKHPSLIACVVRKWKWIYWKKSCKSQENAW